MRFLTTSSGTRPWLVSALWTIFAVAGMISIVLAFSMLLDPKLTESGICIFKFNFTSLMPSQLLYDGDHDLATVVPNISSGDIPPIVSSGLPAVESVASQVQAAPSAVSSSLQSVTTDAAAAAQSGLEEVVPINMSVGLGTLCFGWENGTLNCHNLPLNISSIVPGTFSAILGSPIQQLQDIEDIVAAMTLETIRRCLIAGIVLLLAFSLILLFWKFPNNLWRKVILASLGMSCLVVPFLVSTAIMFVVQTDISDKIKNTTFVSVQDGDASKLGLIGLIFSAIMFTAVIGITML